MTREEAQNIIHYITTWTDYGKVARDTDIEGLVNKIYDDFESRTCGNCKYYREQEFCDEGNCDVITYPCWIESEACHEDVELRVSSDFGCNKWEKE